MSTTKHRITACILALATAGMGLSSVGITAFAETIRPAGSPAVRDDTEGIEDSLMMWRDNGRWNDVPNDGYLTLDGYLPETFGFLCEWDDTSQGLVNRNAYSRIQAEENDTVEGSAYTAPTSNPDAGEVG